MKRNMKTRLFSGLIALCMLLTFLPTTAFAADGDVAQVGDKTYATLDQAVEEAPEGSTITLLQDCELTKGFNKTLTFTGNGKITIDRQLTSNGEGWMCFGLNDPSRVLTFDGAGVSVEWTSDGTSPWLMLSLSGTLNVTNGAELTFKFDSRTTGTRNAIYMNAGSKINVTDGSTFQILGVGTEGNAGQGIQLDAAGTANVNVTGGSKFLIDGTNRGYVNSPTIYVEDSTFAIQNCTSNASNGGKFTAINSQITFENNNGHGLSASNVTIENSVLNCNNNAYYGITYSGDMTMDETSVINANENGYGYTGGGLRAYGVSTVEAKAEINILNNVRNGMENYGTFNIAEGAKFTVTGNDEPSTNGGGIYNGGRLVLPSTAVIMNNSAHQTGGGICNAGTVTIPVGVKLYNNHAGTAGDDLYNRNGANATLTDVGDMWVLDDCDHLIDGWYDDAEGTRWEAHAETEDGNHIEEFTDFSEETGLATVSGLTSLKAAHGKDPIDKTSFPGLDKVIVTEEGDKKEDTAAAGDTVDFKLTSNVPDDLLNYIKPEEADDPEVVNTLANVPVEDRGEYKLTFHDDMNDMFIDPTNFVVKVGDDELIQPDQYTINYEPAQHEDGTTCDFEITVDLVNLYEMGAIDDEDIANATPITVTYTATLSKEATAGSYQNTAWVTYPDGETEKSIVKVNTYKIDVFKYDQTNEEKGLEGAKFEFYQKDGEGNPINVVVELTSDANGHIILDGLDAGVYYLKETEAPEGYVCSNEELTITIPDQADASNVVTVKFANSPVPHTGGTGTMLFTVGGMGILAAAGAVMIVPRKFRKKEEC